MNDKHLPKNDQDGFIQIIQWNLETLHEKTSRLDHSLMKLNDERARDSVALRIAGVLSFFCIGWILNDIVSMKTISDDTYQDLKIHLTEIKGNNRSNLPNKSGQFIYQEIPSKASREYKNPNIVPRIYEANIPSSNELPRQPNNHNFESDEIFFPSPKAPRKTFENSATNIPLAQIAKRPYSELNSEAGIRKNTLRHEKITSGSIISDDYLLNFDDSVIDPNDELLLLNDDD